MTFHRSMINAYSLLGYSKDKKGICHGFSLRWLEAALLQEEDLFNERVTYVAKSGEQLPYLINEVKAKKGIALNHEDKNLLEVAAFFDSVSLYQSPEKHHAVFNVKQANTPFNLDGLLQDDFTLISNYASSDKIQKLGGLTSIYSQSIIGTDKEISEYFLNLGKLLEETNINQDTFAFKFGNTKHAMAMTYTRGKGWRFMDINQYPVKSLAPLQTKELASLVRQGIGYHDWVNGTSYTSFNLSLITTKNKLAPAELTLLTDQLNDFKNQYKKRKLPLATVLNRTNFIQLVLNGNDAEMMERLAQSGVDLNKINDKGFRPAHTAALRGDVVMLRALNNGKADFNKEGKGGITPLHVAAARGKLPALIFLAQSGADLNAAINFVTPAVLAVMNSNIAMIEELIKLGVDFRTVLRMGELQIPQSVLPYAYAQDRKQHAVTQLLERHQAKLDQQTIKELTTQQPIFDELMQHLALIQHNVAQKYKKNPVAYKQINQELNTLYTSLRAKGTLFFNKPNLGSLDELRLACATYKSAHKAAQTHRGIWFQVHSIIRGILGILAGITVIPALILSSISKYSYRSIFFSAPKTKTEAGLDEFQMKMGTQLKL